MDAGQIKSRKRVADHGEVFTNEREVNAMLNLVKDETERIDSRFLEPACGDGNFLIVVLQRKLAVVKKHYGRKQSRQDYEKYSILALSSLYGVDILEDNVEECRSRLYLEWESSYSKQCRQEANDMCRAAARYILNHNILCGDALTMLQNDGTPIIFAQWDLVSGNKMKRRDYRLDQLMRDSSDQIDMDSYMNNMVYDIEIDAWIPSPIAEYPLMNYWEVQDAFEP